MPVLHISPNLLSPWSSDQLHSLLSLWSERRGWGVFSPPWHPAFHLFLLIEGGWNAGPLEAAVALDAGKLSPSSS